MDLSTLAAGSAIAYILAQAYVRHAEELEAIMPKTIRERRTEEILHAGKLAYRAYQDEADGLIGNPAAEKRASDMPVQLAPFTHLGQPIWFLWADGSGIPKQVFDLSVIDF